MDMKTRNYILEVSEINKDRPWIYDKTIFVNSNTKLKVTCELHGEFESYYDSIKKGMGCRKCAYLKGDKKIEALKDINLNEIFLKNLEIAETHNIPQSLREPKQMKRIEEMINKPIIKNNDGIELAVPTEWMNAKFYADIGIDDLSHYYKCALSRAAQYKNKDLRAQYKDLSAVIKKQIENRSKIKDDEIEVVNKKQEG